MRVLVTGSSGFIGSRLVGEIPCRGMHQVTAISRTQARESVSGVSYGLADIDGNTDWSELLVECEVVIHIAAVAHLSRSSPVGVLDRYRAVNIEGTLNLALKAAGAGVKRFIFLSSIGVNGNINTRPFTEDDTPNPTEHYAQSKWEAEQGLWEIHCKTGMELVIIRPPLVYGPNAPGNFGSLMRWSEKGVPLPLGAIHNQRSLVALDNLVDLIITCIDHPAAANQVFLAGDGRDLSTTELLRGVAKAGGEAYKLIPIPSSLLLLAATLIGKKALAQRLIGSLQVDISKARELLGWEPPISVEEGLRRCFIRD